jgi:transposase
MRDRGVWNTLLGLAPPWRVRDVELALSQGEVRIFVEVEPGAQLRCPRCGQTYAGYDSRERRADGGSRFTALFEALVIDWLHEASFAAVARQLRLTWEAVAIHCHEKAAELPGASGIGTAGPGSSTI